MKELELKLQELKEGVENTNQTILNIKVEIAHCKQLHLDYLSYELILNKCIETKKELNQKITTIEEAIKILKGEN